MTSDKRKVALIGAGMVGMSYAFALLGSGACDELVLIDIDKERAVGEAMDLNDGMTFAPSRMRIWAGDYSDCHDADIAVITAGAAQAEGETRLDLLHKNAKIVRSVVNSVISSGFDGIILVASNPVDIMTMVAREASGLKKGKVFGSGTTLDTARLRYSLGQYFGIDPRNIHAYVMGEHGDSEFVPWSQALISTLPVVDMCKRDCFCDSDDLDGISEGVKDAAYVIIKAKSATYYGIAMALVRITKAIFSNEHSILTLSAPLDGEYGESGVSVGVPSVIGREGITGILQLNLTADERMVFEKCFI